MHRFTKRTVCLLAMLYIFLIIAPDIAGAMIVSPEEEALDEGYLPVESNGAETPVTIEGMETGNSATIEVIKAIDSATIEGDEAGVTDTVEDEEDETSVTVDDRAGEVYLTIDSKGDEVLSIKKRLKELRYYTSGTFTKKYTEDTAKVVRHFQAQNGLPETGDVDQATWDALFAETALPLPWPTLTPLATPAPPPEMNAPETDSEGFLPEAGEYFFEDDEAGYWVYIGQNLRVKIQRNEDASIPLTWFETEIWLRNGEALRTVATDPAHPGKSFRYPYVISRDEKIVSKAMKEIALKYALNTDFEILVNPTGKFEIGGPFADSGVTGRKLACDTYGGVGHIGGGAMSGKDPTKVDRSGAYITRKIARDIVTAGYADKCEVQIAYAIGVAEPVSIHVETFGTEHQDISFIEAYVRENYDLTPNGIIDGLGLRDVDYSKVSCGGHFGKAGLPWEV